MKPCDDGPGVGSLPYRQAWKNALVLLIHFTPKASAPLLQVADAVAFGLRRYFSEESEGVDFGKAVMGEDMNLLKRTKDCESGILCMDPVASETLFTG